MDECRRALAWVRSLLLACASLLAPAVASAEEHASPATERDQPHPDDDTSPLDVGVIGGLGFPRPLALEGVVRVHETVLLGAEYSFLPKTTFSSVDTRLWAAAADLRVFPFKGAFFVGVRGGYQKLSAEATLTAAGVGSYTESVDVGTWFVNPRIGFMWVWKPLTFGIDAGVQIPLSTTVSRSSLLALASPDLDAKVTSASDMLGRTPLPTIDLLRLGLLF